MAAWPTQISLLELMNVSMAEIPYKEIHSAYSKKWDGVEYVND
jgi:hypothetical protein